MYGFTIVCALTSAVAWLGLYMAGSISHEQNAHLEPLLGREDEDDDNASSKR